jgi:site-specific recombinase XerD
MTEIHRLGVGVGGRLMISVYLRDHKTGPCYYARFKVSNSKSGNGQRYITESLRTDDFHHAVEVARTRYAEINLMEKENRYIKTESVSVAIDKFIRDYEHGVEQRRSSHSVSMLVSFKKTVDKYWKDYIGHLDLKLVSWDQMNDYEKWRQDFYLNKKKSGKKIHPNAKLVASKRTIESEINNFKTFLRWCSIKGMYSGTALDFKFKNLQGNNKRSAFTTQQWTALTGFMRRKSWTVVGRRGNDSRLIRYRHMLKAYVLFMKNTGLRVGESRNLRWSDVEFLSNADPSKCYVRVKVLRENSKTRKSSVIVGNEGAYNALMDWFQHRVDAKNLTKKEDPIWCEQDGKVINDFREGFNTLIRDAKVEHDASGQKLTIYSLRHTYITEQLKNGVPVYTIASNCNTSVAMIERYYSDARPQDFEKSLTEGYRRVARSTAVEKIVKTQTVKKPASNKKLPV